MRKRFRYSASPHVALDNGTVGSEKNDLRNSVYAIKIGRLVLRIIYHRPLDTESFHGLLSSFALVPHGYAHDFESVATESVVDSDKIIGDFPSARTAPRCPEIHIENKEAVMDLLRSGKNIGEVCRIFNVSRDTFRKFRKLYPEIESCIAH